eukprot:6628998-Ditylum_brightwellii.AAC.1
MLGKLLWDSFSPKFKIEMLTEKEKLKRGKGYDGVIFWKHLINNVSVSAYNLVGKLKDKLKTAMLKSFDQDIEVLNACFVNKETAIVKEVNKRGIHQIHEVPLQDLQNGQQQGVLGNDSQRKAQVDAWVSLKWLQIRKPNGVGPQDLQQPRGSCGVGCWYKAGQANKG